MPNSAQSFLVATPEALLEFEVNTDTWTWVEKRSTPLKNRLSALCLSPDRLHLYAATQGDPDPEGHTGQLLTWTRKDRGSPFIPLEQPTPISTQGVTPCYLSHHPSLPLLAVTNFRGPGDRNSSAGSVVLFSVDKQGAPIKVRSRLTFPGSGPNLPRQAASHPHCAVFTTSPDVLRVADLGTDSVWSIPLDIDAPRLCGAPLRFSTEPGSGPRHLAVVENGHALLLVTEMTNNLLWLQPGADTSLSPVTKISLLPQGNARAAAADVLVSPDSRFVYSSLRQLDDVASFALDLSAQTLIPGPRTSSIGAGPRWLALSIDGKVLAIANTGGPSRSVDFLSCDPTTGHLQPTELSIPDATLVIGT